MKDYTLLKKENRDKLGKLLRKLKISEKAIPRTICETIRDIKRECKGNKKVQELCDEAIGYAKKMNLKLRDYKYSWYEDIIKNGNKNQR